MHRHFMITINLTDEDELRQRNSLAELDDELFALINLNGTNRSHFGGRIRYLTGQLEAGSETGRWHWQLYLETTESMRISTVVNILKRIFGKSTSVRVEVRRGSQQQAIAYVTKEESRIKGPFSHGTPAPSRAKGKPKHKSILLDCIARGVSPRDIWVNHPDVYMTHWRFIEHLSRTGLYGVPPVSEEE